MLKKNYKARVAANQFDLTTLPICGARTRSGGLCKHKGNIRNGRCKRHGGDSTGPINQAFGKSHHRYVHGLRTKEVIIIRKLVADLHQSLNDLVKQPE
jgi:hypothetical protein